MYYLVDMTTGEVLAENASPHRMTSLIVRKFYMRRLCDMAIATPQGEYIGSWNFIGMYRL